MGFSKRDIEILMYALNKHMWCGDISNKEKEECVRLERILKKLHKQKVSKL